MIDSRQAAWRLLVTLGLMTLGGSGMYTVAVVLPAVQAEFGVTRADASIPYTLMMLGFGLGGVFMGRWADKAGVHVPAAFGGLALGVGFVLAGLSGSIWTFAIAHGLFLGLLGSASTFAPL
ncbi:MAG: putative MFS-type transporter YhjX, partial [Pseudomonadota bacterium]